MSENVPCPTLSSLLSLHVILIASYPVQILVVIRVAPVRAGVVQASLAHCSRLPRIGEKIENIF